MVAIEWRLDGGSDVVIWVGAAIMKWRFGSVKEKIRRFGGEASGRNKRSFEEEIREGYFWRGGEIFGRIVRSSVEGSLVVLVIFHCI